MCRKLNWSAPGPTTFSKYVINLIFGMLRYSSTASEIIFSDILSLARAFPRLSNKIVRKIQQKHLFSDSEECITRQTRAKLKG